MQIVKSDLYDELTKFLCSQALAGSLGVHVERFLHNLELHDAFAHAVEEAGQGVQKDGDFSDVGKTLVLVVEEAPDGQLPAVVPIDDGIIHDLRILHLTGVRKLQLVGLGRKRNHCQLLSIRVKLFEVNSALRGNVGFLQFGQTFESFNSESTEK